MQAIFMESLCKGLYQHNQATALFTEAHVWLTRLRVWIIMFEGLFQLLDLPVLLLSAIL